MPNRLSRRTVFAGFACIGFASPARAGVLSPRALYEAEARPSALARAQQGRRVALRGFLTPSPSPEPGWVALAEMPVAPCTLCGLTHDWPVGVVAVEAAALPHVPSAFQAVTLEGVLDLAPEGAAAAGLPGRVTLRDATLRAA
jgi:hypothetical protein